jgi:hypothetical protein
MADGFGCAVWFADGALFIVTLIIAARNVGGNMPLPHDIARCAVPCALPCRRAEPGHPTYQVTAHFPGGISCPGRIQQPDGAEG